MEGGAVGHNFERDPPKDHPSQGTKLHQTWEGWSLGGSLSNFVFDSSSLHSRWLLLLKIEISSKTTHCHVAAVKI
jgi:hypothetical protein